MEYLLNNLLAVTILMILGWGVSVYQRNVTIVDSLWGMGFVLIVWLTMLQVEGYRGRQLLIVGLTTLWGIRLTLYLTWRNHGKGEDPRYEKWRQTSGDRFWLTSLFKVFLLQAFFLWLIALVIQVGQVSRVPERLGIFDFIGTLVWTIGFVFESLGDWQLARFKSNPDNRRKVMDRGLWRYSRHPNYFGESLIWWGLFIIVMSNPQNWWTVLSPATITLVLLKMTGVPLTETLILEKRPGYMDYIKHTSVFLPWVPKRPDNHVETYHENTDPTG